MSLALVCALTQPWYRKAHLNNNSHGSGSSSNNSNTKNKSSNG